MRLAPRDWSWGPRFPALARLPLTPTARILNVLDCRLALPRLAAHLTQPHGDLNIPVEFSSYFCEAFGLRNVVAVMLEH
jgi:hypothetical protein